MQAIAEAYLLLKYAGGFFNEELADMFAGGIRVNLRVI